jgi:glycosyltransferase involved in cell wall biosynthesis
MVAYTLYESDNRVRKYAEALARAGFGVDVIAISGQHRAAKEPTVLNGVAIYHMMQRVRDERNKWSYLSRLTRFFALALMKLSSLQLRHRYDVIHVHNMPDFLVFTAIVPKLTGSKIILDIHDLTPEMFAEKFPQRSKSGYITLLERVERAAIAFSDHVIISNDLWRQKLLVRSVQSAKCTSIINYLDSSVFYPHARTRDREKWILLFPGTLQRHQGVDIAIHALAKVRAACANVEFHIYGEATGTHGSELKALIEALRLENAVRLYDPVSLDQMPQIVADADIGVVPKRAEAFGNEAFSTKILEFMSQGVPVVVSKTKVDSYYYNEDTVRFFTPGDSDSLAQEILEVIQNADLRQRLIENGLHCASENSWERKKDIYLGIIHSLSPSRPG